MRCHRCGRPISPLRQLTDLEFCSENCRKRGPRASASVIRDVEYEVDPYWQAAQEQANKPASKASNAALATLVAGLVGAMVVARIWFPDAGAGAGGPSPLAQVAPTTSPQTEAAARDRALRQEDTGLTGWLQRHLPGEKPLQAKVDFSLQDADWLGSATGWSRRGGAIQPGLLRLWKPTLAAKDYAMEFQASIEKRGVSWVFRAQDNRHYYATKILLSKAGQAPGASIVRYGRQSAVEFSRTELPLPIVLQREKNYRITLLAEGNRFTTLIDGRVVDEWTDGRLKAGGVGFFAEDGESAGIQWASFRERKGVLSRLISANLLLPPGMLY